MTEAADIAITGWGTTISGDHSTIGALNYIRSISIAGMDVADVDVTVLDSPEEWMEYVPGLKEPGTLDLEVLYEEDEYEKLWGVIGTMQTWTITFPDDSTWVCDGYVKGQPLEVPRESEMVVSFSIKLSGKPVFSAV